MKAVILARISSKEQRDGHSLDAQIRNLELYAQRKKLDIVKSYTLVESSTRAERPEFDKMIAFIKAQKTKVALVVDCVDRLQRSFRETPILNALMEQDALEIHFVKEGNVLAKDANSTQKLMWNMGVMMAQSYTDQLSDNVRRSFKFKIRNGEWCGRAPFGYLNARDEITGKSIVIPDANNADIIRRIFIEYASGAYSLSELTRKSREWGLRSKNGNKVGIQSLHHMIQNPFYYGVMKINGELHAHKYEPTTTKAIFDMCQDVREGRNNNSGPKETKHPFLFRGLLTCGVSGKQVTCDLKKGKYVYLICNDPANPDKKMWIKESAIIEQVEEVFKSIQVPEQYLPDLLAYIQNMHESEKEFHHNVIDDLHLDIRQIDMQLDKLTDLLISDSIDKNTYNRKFTQLQERRRELSLTQEEHHTGNEQFKKALSTLVLLASRAYDIFKSSKIDEKRALITFAFSNFSLQGGKLRYALAEPLSCFQNLGSYKEWLCSPNKIKLCRCCNALV